MKLVQNNMIREISLMRIKLKTLRGGFDHRHYRSKSGNCSARLDYLLQDNKRPQLRPRSFLLQSHAHFMELDHAPQIIGTENGLRLDHEKVWSDCVLMLGN